MGAVKQKQRKDFRGSIVGDHGTSFFRFSGAERPLPRCHAEGTHTLKIGDFGVKAGIGL